MVTSKWDIEITDLQMKTKVGNAEDVNHTLDMLNANMEANFYLPGDTITYEVTVSNLGSLDAILDSIKINMDSQDIIEFKVDGIMSGDVLKQGESTKFDVIMKYNENITEQPDMESVIFNMNLNYLQNGNSSNFSEADTDVLDVLAIKGIDLDISETSVKADISASNAFKYYYSLDNDKWYESTENMYTIYHLMPYTNYVMYVKAEDTKGEVVFSSKEFKTLDNTKPDLKFEIGNNIKGNNGWYKGLDINIIAKDAGEISESKYCVTSNDTCEPNTDLALTEGKGTYQFASSNNNQTLCVLIKDRKGNGKLTKPVGLITADEVSMAGGRTDSQNTLYYLYTGNKFWTMTPAYFRSVSYVHMFNINNNGNINVPAVTDNSGIRPVANLKTDNLTFTGTGTMQNPYVIS